MGITVVKQMKNTNSLLGDSSQLKLQMLADEHCRAQYPILNRCEEIFHDLVDMKDCKQAMKLYKQCYNETYKKLNNQRG